MKGFQENRVSCLLCNSLGQSQLKVNKRGVCLSTRHPHVLTGPIHNSASQYSVSSQRIIFKFRGG